ncbi:aldehyde dehydrogenase family protein [Streptomyces sp. YU58]|uniref:aldehyde dehydrogenase family protein n=1 Tax=Streptomyces sp. SX92 TaxID=3158972 RepID=UPI0027BA7E14|nr:aldehyde dehydrogenase family protein [Streptomyces coralus]WLW57521.1 aldehyde dehydrogenase family protein [Streptomyces coralus]
MCAKRFVVAAPVADAFTAAFVAGAEALHVGDPSERDTQVGPLAALTVARDDEDAVRLANATPMDSA